jgi:putative pyruvate formate lyase activating enzyme
MDPSYLALYSSGELHHRAKMLEARLQSCNICPRECYVNRLENKHGFCHSGYLPIVSSICAHHGEEPAISGTRGTGAIFFGNCNMRCVYCQNYQISQDPEYQVSREVEINVLVGHMLYLQDKLGCHSISFISPSHFAAQLVVALLEAIPQGLHIPLIYNTNAYDSIATLQLLDNIIDVYLPDLKYDSDVFAERFSYTSNYVFTAHKAIREMYRQVGGRLVLNEMGLVQRGLIIRHLILPNQLAGSGKVLSWIARQISPDITMSIMAQYFPTHLASQIPQLCRKISESEYKETLDVLGKLNFKNGWIQEMDAAENYKPNFQDIEHPFY